MSIEIAEVVSTKKTYKPSKSILGKPLPLGAIKIRVAGGSGGAPRIERFAFPLFNFTQVPLEGEHVILLKGPSDLKNPATMGTVHYYLGPVAVHGNKHLNPMPGAFDVTKIGSPLYLAAAGGAAVVNKFKKYKPGVNFKEVKTIPNLQPYEGDVLVEGRNGQALRLGASMKGSLTHYEQQPFYKGKQGAPITIISNGYKGSAPSLGGGSFSSNVVGQLANKALSGQVSSYGIEDPNETDSIFIMTSDSHKIDMKLAKKSKKIGKNVKKLSSYVKPQIIQSADRLILNAKTDEIILIGKKDVKIVTKDWNSDMDEFFAQVLDFMEEVINQNKELEKLHKEVSSMAQANMMSIHPTGVGPSGPPTNAAAFGKTKGKATSGASKTKSLRTKLEKIRDVIKEMKG